MNKENKIEEINQFCEFLRSKYGRSFSVYDGDNYKHTCLGVQFVDITEARNYFEMYLKGDIKLGDIPFGGNTPLSLTDKE